MFAMRDRLAVQLELTCSLGDLMFADRACATARVVFEVLKLAFDCFQRVSESSRNHIIK